MRAPAQRPGDSAGCSGGSGSNSYAGSWHQERTDLRASAAVHHRPVSSGAGQTPPGGQLIRGLVDADRAAMGFAEGPQSLLDQGRIGQHPAVQGGVVDLKAPLEEQLLNVAIAHFDFARFVTL